MSRWHKHEWDMLPERAFQPRGWKGGMTLEGGKDQAAPDPRLGKASEEQVALNRQMYQDYRAVDAPFMQDIAKRVLGISEGNAARAGALSDFQLDQMRRNDARYQSTVVPLENELIQDARRYDSEAYKEGMVGRAMADAQQSFDQVRTQGLRMQARMGLNPADAKFFGPQMEIAQANALTSAANKTRLAADQIGLSTKLQTYGGIKGIAGLGATNAQLAIGAIGAGNQSGAGMTNAYGSYLNANNAAAGVMNQGVGVGLTGLSNYSAQGIQAAQANNAADPFNTILGAAAGGFASSFKWSDRRLKQDIVRVGTDSRTGLSLYEFSYVNGSGKRFRGVMADEVEAVDPHAVVYDDLGFAMVDYSRIGVEMVEV